MLGAASLCAALWAWPYEASGAGGLVYVFLHSALKTKALETLVSDALPGNTVIVFSRYKDLAAALESKPPAALLTYPPVIEAHGLKVAAMGYRGGKAFEPYVFLTVGKSAPAEMGGKTLGVIDMLGRKAMQTYVETLVKGGATAKLNRVVKLEDLLPLLQFGSADAALVSASGAQDIKSKSQQDLRVVAVPGANAPLPSLAVLTGEVAVFKKSLDSMKRDAKEALGVDSWR